MWWVVGVVTVVVLASTYLTWTASRVDRLHARAAAAARALDAHLLRRAAAAAVLAEERAAIELYAAARIALDAPDLATGAPDGAGREAAENDLTRQLRAISLGPDAEALVAASRRLAVARQVYTDLVRDALSVRRRPTVRLLRMTRRHPEPEYFDIDDPILAPVSVTPVSPLS
ncbi:hypothetical protein GCM10022251_10020 [Phytohabitans flavus]|uniref:NUDIX hydrolase n=1 Tax=Phytohabitans flavus TaxID=1076124 RepID=A0A6F8XK61_9ACTN|nr:hypothetical protein [Phytohabitans flavus]BCB74200.1 hypothetical protein Pflav_006100 [Phytohabitans flavus]